ncbi:MAG: ABC transporter permease [Phycisphaeraceae bacterium]|nr:ABC transporter permease [Phycisphaeraceae bacterium]
MLDGNLGKIATIAWREFRHTALTKSFLFGAVALPLLMGAGLLLFPLLLASQSEPLEGTIAVVDPTGRFAPTFDALVIERQERDGSQEAKDVMKRLGIDDKTGFISQGLAQAGESPYGEVSATGFTSNDEETIERLKAEARDGDWLAVAVVPARQIESAPTSDEDLPDIELFLPRSTSPGHTNDLEGLVRSATVRTRFIAAGEDFEQVQTMLDRPSIDVRRFGEDGAADAEESKLRMIVPFGFMMLLWIATFTAGNFLLTSTIEEKSNKVIEVVLSAVGPLQLLWGKILGLALVSLVILVTYGGLAIASLTALALTDLLAWTTLAWAVIFFLIAYFTIASLMAAIGSAVNELSEAQTFMAPVMIVMVLPMLLWAPIAENPDGTLAVVSSMLPPILPFAMVMRIGSATEPIPIWQMLLSTGLGIATVAGLVWAASRIFRVGILMQGKPPSPLELLRWIRQT